MPKLSVKCTAAWEIPRVLLPSPVKPVALLDDCGWGRARRFPYLPFPTVGSDDVYRVPQRTQRLMGRLSLSTVEWGCEVTIQRRRIFNAFQQIDRRSDRVDDSRQLISAFTDTGSLFSKLSSTQNQILYGRRGTGKTHALTYLMKTIPSRDEICIFIDMRKIGSDGAILYDDQIELKEKAIRLLIESLKYIHDEIRTFCLNDVEKFNFHLSAPLLNEFLSAITKTKVVGEKQTSAQNIAKQISKSSAKLAFYQPAMEAMFEDLEEYQDLTSQAYSGKEAPDLSTRNICRITEEMVKAIGVKRIWILFDEWSSIPVTLQPYLSEMLKKFFIPISRITIKIAAIEQRSQFQAIVARNLIGLELGADIMADIVLDDFLVFDNAHDRAVEFFKKLFFNHLKSLLVGDDCVHMPLLIEEMIGICFQTVDAFRELTRASEGVPRDAINILGIAIQYAGDDRISMKNVREAAKRWYETDKLNPISSNETAGKLLNWIMDEVLGNRRTRAFLVESHLKDKQIDFLFDHRIIHIQKRSISAKSSPGRRYTAYAIDYGCYIDLAATSKRPLGYLLDDSESNPEEVVYVPDVPKDDMRSTRRSILDLEAFKKEIG